MQCTQQSLLSECLPQCLRNESLVFLRIDIYDMLSLDVIGRAVGFRFWTWTPRFNMIQFLDSLILTERAALVEVEAAEKKQHCMQAFPFKQSFHFQSSNPGRFLDFVLVVAMQLNRSCLIVITAPSEFLYLSPT